MRIWVGSTRPAKVDAVRAAVRAIAAVQPAFGSATVEAVDVANVAPAMPMSAAAILAGARARVAALLERAAGLDAAARPALLVGLEGGLDQMWLDGARRFALTSWAAVSDGRRWSYGAGGTILLPDDLAAAVAAGAELGDLVDARAGPGARSTRGAWGVLTRDLVTRRDVFRTAVLSALAPFFNPSCYR